MRYAYHVLCEKPFLNMQGRLPWKMKVDAANEESAMGIFLMAQSTYANITVNRCRYNDKWECISEHTIDSRIIG